MRSLRANYAILCCLMACAAMSPTSTAQSAEGDALILRIDSHMAMLDSLIHRTAAPAAGYRTPLSRSVEAAPDTLYGAAVDAVAQARISAIKAATGVQLTGQTYYRADGALGLDDDDEAVSRYTGKIQIEARWYFLQSGLLKRQGRIDEQLLKADVSRLEHERGRNLPGLYASRERLRVISDSILASVMLHRVDNLQLLQDAYMYLLDNQDISSDDLLRILDDRAEAERRLSTIAGAHIRASWLSSVTAGTVTIDTTAVLQALAANDLDLRILDAKSRLLDTQAANTTWWSDVRLAPFVRYSHYFRHDLPSSANVDMGLSFTIPINAEASRHRDALRAEKDVIECERADLLLRGADKVRYIALETERLNGAIAGEWQRANTLREYLSNRRNAYDNRIGEYNRLLALKEYNMYLRCLENIIEIQYRRDSLLADLQALVPEVPVLDFCSFTLLKQ